MNDIRRLELGIKLVSQNTVLASPCREPMLRISRVPRNFSKMLVFRASCHPRLGYEMSVLLLVGCVLDLDYSPRLLSSASHSCRQNQSN